MTFYVIDASTFGTALLAERAIGEFALHWSGRMASTHEKVVLNPAEFA